MDRVSSADIEDLPIVLNFIWGQKMDRSNAVDVSRPFARAVVLNILFTVM